MNKIKNKIKDFVDHWFGSFPSFDEACKPDFPSIILPIIRRVMPSIIAHDICGVSPMTGPTESIATLRARYADSQRPTMEQLLENTRQRLIEKNDKTSK